jgi:hypothetical protein
MYQAVPAEDAILLEEPLWPEESFRKLFDIAFGPRIIDSMDHLVFKQLRGRA